MKTKYFSRYSFSTENQARIVEIQEMDDSLFNTLKSDLLTTKNPYSPTDAEVRKLIIDSNTIPEKFIKSRNTLLWMLRLLVRHFKDDIQDIIDDIKEIYPNSIKDSTLFKKRMEEIQDMAKQRRLFFRSDIAKDDGLPSLNRLSTSVVIKPVFEERFNFNEIEIQDYKPKRISTIACAVIEFKNTYDKYFCFQLNGIELERLLNDLISLQIELKTFENECN